MIIIDEPMEVDLILWKLILNGYTRKIGSESND